MTQHAVSFHDPLIVIYGRDQLPELVEEMARAIMPNALFVRPKAIPVDQLPAFCEENGGPSLVIFTNEIMSGARATDVMLKLRKLGINTLLMTDEATDLKARLLNLCTMPKFLTPTVLDAHLRLALQGQAAA